MSEARSGLRSKPEMAPTRCEEAHEGRRRRRFLVVTDSNGKGATADSIRNHIVRERHEEFEIEVATMYRLEDAYERILYGRTDVADREVVLDNLTNNIRGGKNHNPTRQSNS